MPETKKIRNTAFKCSHFFLYFKNYIKISIVLFLLLNNVFLFSQEEEKDSISLTDRYTIFEGDTLLIELEEVFLLKKINLASSYERKYYYWFRKKVLNAYPYAQIAADSLEILNENLNKMKKRTY